MRALSPCCPYAPVRAQRRPRKPALTLLRVAALSTLLIISVISALSAAPALAQQDERPSNARPNEPGFLEPAPEQILEPQPPNADPEDALAPAPPSLRVEAFEFQGNTAFTDAELNEALRPYRDRALVTEDLLEARDQITQLYLEAGFETSGVLLPDQVIGRGRVLFQVVEGRLAVVQVKGEKRMDPRFLAREIEAAVGTPLNVRALETVLQTLQQNPLIERILARLEPTSVRGESRLVLELEEARPDDLKLFTANDRSPSVGVATGGFKASSGNWLGRRDQFALAGWFTEGLTDIEARYALPVGAFGTRLTSRIRFSHSEVVENPFDALNIESESLLVSLGIEQSVYRSRRTQIDVGLLGDWRRGQSTLDGSLFCFQPGVTDCSPQVTVLRAFGEWRFRGLESAATVRTQLSWGTGWLGATTRPGNVPDGRFLSWLIQAQAARRVPFGGQLITRFDFQRSDDPLLAFERISVGGARTVRGYRPNQLIRDSGLSGSLEWRTPLWRRSNGPNILELAPFFDIGHAWNEVFDAGDNTIASAGLGLLAHPHERVEASLYWGGRLLGVDRIGDGPIGEGLHFKVVVDAW
ncbi:MAG: ShlB/FhaC/HecB family hemolysin secretion/activation protein [Myxococcota bacterium]